MVNDSTPPIFAESKKPSSKKKKSKVQDLEIKDSQLIFDNVWNELVETYGIENLRFPKEIFWLNGAPGAGKGTHTNFIMNYCDLTAEPVVVSSLLKSPEAQKRMDAGLLVGDQEVTRLILKSLLEPSKQSGVVVDGYPRTNVQVECLKYFYNKLNEVRANFIKQGVKRIIPKPKFHIVVLFVDEQESIKRQIMRGQKAMEHNREVEASGMGRLKELRKTDLSEDAARNRYRTFKEVTYDALLTLRESFHYHYINAQGTISEVQSRIINELRYQSSLELRQETLDLLDKIPLANKISVHARQELVNRLDDYEANHSDLFRKVVCILEEKFMSIIRRHGISGMARVNSEDDIFDNPLALTMALDIFAERGYRCVVDVRKNNIPESVDLQTGKIISSTRKVYRFIINFPGSEIRRGR